MSAWSALHIFVKFPWNPEFQKSAFSVSAQIAVCLWEAWSEHVNELRLKQWQTSHTSLTGILSASRQKCSYVFCFEKCGLKFVFAISNTLTTKLELLLKGQFTQHCTFTHMLLTPISMEALLTSSGLHSHSWVLLEFHRHKEFQPVEVYCGQVPNS